jgi:hypothetical protein
MNSQNNLKGAIADAPLFNGNQIIDYDMVAAVTQASLNTQLFLLWPMLDESHRKMSWAFKREDPEIGLEIDYSFEGEMNPPEVILGTTTSPNFQVKLCINIPMGNLTYGSAKKKTVQINDWKYVFDVDVNFVAINQDRIQSHTAVPNVVKEMLEKFSDNQFTIKHLLMNFQDANIANYDSVHSNLPLPEGTSELVREFFQTGLTNYFKDLAKTDHPYILGFSIESKSATNDPSIPPTFTPTRGTYWIFFEPDQARQGLSALNFLLATGSRTLPPKTEPGFKNNWVTNNDYDGRFVVASGTFFDMFILPRLLKALDRQVVGYGHDDHTYFDVSGGVNWQKAEAPSKDNPHWKYSFSTSSNWDVKDVNVLGTLIHCQHSFSNNNEFSMDLENLDANKAIIKLSGSFKTRHDMLCHPLGIKETFWATTEVDWSGKITLEGGTLGIIKLTSEINTGETKSDRGGNWAGKADLSLIPSNKENLDTMSTWINDKFKNELGSLKNFLGNVNNRFVLPAGAVFAFKNPQFDSYQNLLADVTYKTTP